MLKLKCQKNRCTILISCRFTYGGSRFSRSHIRVTIRHGMDLTNLWRYSVNSSHHDSFRAAHKAMLMWWRFPKDSTWHSILDIIDNVHVCRIKWPGKGTRFRRIPCSYCNLAERRIVLLELYRTVRYHTGREWMHVVWKDDNIPMICLGRCKNDLTSCKMYIFHNVTGTPPACTVPFMQKECLDSLVFYPHPNNGHSLDAIGNVIR